MSRIEKLDSHIKRLEELTVYQNCDEDTLIQAYSRCISELKEKQHDADEDLYYCELKRGFLECVIAHTTPMIYYQELKRLKEERGLLAHG